MLCVLSWGWAVAVTVDVDIFFHIVTGAPLKGGRISQSGRWVEGETALRRSANQPGPADYVSEYNGIEANARRTTAR